MSSGIKPITGTWFSIYWKDKRHYYWNGACLEYTDKQWEALIADLHSAGMEYIVMCNTVALDGLAVFRSRYAPMADMAAEDPLETVLCACDRLDMKLFMSNDYIGETAFGTLMKPENVKLRELLMEELAEKYAHHKSFYGWYWANESWLSPYFQEDFIEYINASSRHARLLTPDAKILTAPYGTSSAVCDDRFVRQLDKLDVDIIAYQDTVGCYATDIAGSERAFAELRKAHDRVPRIALWADVETFTWEGRPNDQATPLIPAEFPRLVSQLKAVSPYVDRTLVFIFQGLFSNPDSIAHTGYDKAAKYWNEYTSWLKNNQ